MAQIALIQGGTGGLGTSFVEQLLNSNRFDRILVTSRRLSQIEISDARIYPIELDLRSDVSIAEAQMLCRELTDRIHLMISTAGILKTDMISPEKKLSDLSRNALESVFSVNCFGPFLFLSGLMSLFRHRDPLVIATLSARVGSISDNGLGGWHSYRASKAAQNMLTKNLSLELKRTNPNAIVVGLHPGTVETNLSKPFQANVPKDKLFKPHQSAKYLLDVIERLTPDQTGRVFAWDGSEVPA